MLILLLICEPFFRTWHSGHWFWCGGDQNTVAGLNVSAPTGVTRDQNSISLTLLTLELVMTYTSLASLINVCNQEHWLAVLVL